MLISRKDVQDYIQVHSITFGYMGYSIGLDGGYVIREDRSLNMWIFEMGDYIEEDWEFFRDTVMGDKLFSMIRRLCYIYGEEHFMIYGHSGDLYLCLDFSGDGEKYDKLKGLYSINGDLNSLEVVNYVGRIYYKYKIKYIDGFMAILDLLGL